MTSYLVDWHGRSCIIDERKQPENGDEVLIDMSGMYEWARGYLHPKRLVTDDGIALDDDLLEDVAIIGVVTHEVTALNERDSDPF